MRRLDALAFDNSYARLHPAFYEVIDPTPLPDPYLVAFNPDAAALIDLDPAESANPDLAACLTGGRRIPGSEPVAQVYAGHQFGVWVPRLGDGRAFLLGEVRNARGERWDLHLKGGGTTRFSRGGDGRSVLRSAIREYLGSEAMHGLGIPTTRALAIAGSEFPVRRESVETAATLLRLSPSHVRFGTFEYFAARGEPERVRELADFVIARHFTAGEPAGPARDDGRYPRFLAEVVRRAAELVARWTAAGFCHGVLNTDNMSVLGLTLDYGPFGFLDELDTGHISNHSDGEGRYAYDQQPAVGLWNLTRFAHALGGLVSADEAGAALASYPETFAATYGRLMRARLGLVTEQAEDPALVRDLLALLERHRVDYARFFRLLSLPCRDAAGAPRVPAPLLDLFPARAEPEAWLGRYLARLGAEPGPEPDRVARMRAVNPAYVLRNWMAEEAIRRARERDYGLIEELRLLLRDPFTERPEGDRWAAVPPVWARDLAVSCSS
ncbi:MAG TPA: YdiU family protein [Gemmatimonadales bacterium]|nr:YdiU family protein [Gemmatimonadales bacterium]